MNIGELIASLGLDNKQFLAGIAISQSSMLGLSKNLSKLAVPALVIGGTIALAKGISKATDAAAKLQKSMANVATLVDKPQKEIAALTSEVQNMTTEVLKSSEDLSAGLYQVFSAGITDSAEAMDVLKASSIAATAGLSDTRTSVDAITTIINAYGLEARKATHVSDLLFQTVRLGKTTYEELAGAIGTVTSVAATVGVELEDLFGILATLTKGGIATKRATTGLRATLLSIIKPAEGARKKAKELGLEWNAAAVRTKGLVGFLNDMRDAVDGNEEAISELIPNARALSVVMALTGKQNKELNRIMGEFSDVSGSSAEAFKKQADTVILQSKRMSLAIDRLIEKLGKLTIGPKQKIVTGLADFFVGLDEDLASIPKSINSVRTGFSNLFDLLKKGALKGTSLDQITNQIVNVNKEAAKAKEQIIEFSTGINLLLRPIEFNPFKNIEDFPSVFNENLIKETKKAAEIIKNTWERTSDDIKAAFEDLGIVPEAQFDEIIQNTLKSFEIVTRELDKRGELNVETATKIRQKLIDRLKEVSTEAAESGFIIDDEQVEKIEGLLGDLGDSSVRTAHKVISDTEKLADATTVTIERGALDTDRFITKTATEAINSFRDVGLNVTSTLATEFSNTANAHVAAWRSSTEGMKELDISYTDSFLGELDKRKDGFDAFARSIKAKAAELRQTIEAASSFPGQITSFEVPVRHQGVLSAPKTELSLIEKGELIIPAAQNPFNPAATQVNTDNREFNISINQQGNLQDQLYELKRGLNNPEIVSI
jgi:TP901 family phage tail tape measure protein